MYGNMSLLERTMTLCLFFYTIEEQTDTQFAKLNFYSGKFTFFFIEKN